MSGNGIKNNEVIKFIQQIIRKLNLTATVMKNDKVNSFDNDNKTNKINKILIQFKKH